MNGLLGMQSLLLTTELTPLQLDYVNTGQASGSALLSLINDILDFSKVTGFQRSSVVAWSAC